MPRNARYFLAVLGTFLVATPAIAQSTGTPIYLAPYRPFAHGEWGASIADPGSGYALEGSYRTVFVNKVDFGFRAGIAESGGNNSVSSGLFGTDVRARVLDHNESFPFDGSFTVGIGMNTRKNVTVGYLPIGVSLGRRILIEGSSVSLVPYVHPVLTPVFGDVSGTKFTFGFGLDARITPRFDLRFSAGVGDVDGIGFTAAFLH
jgi:hypothetical protein